MGVRTCGRAGVQMGVQKWMTVKKEGKKKKRLTGFQSGRMGVWTCCGWACVNVLAGRCEWL